jgi:hypothetical protein
MDGLGPCPYVRRYECDLLEGERPSHGSRGKGLGKTEANPAGLQFQDRLQGTVGLGRPDDNVVFSKVRHSLVCIIRY